MSMRITPLGISPTSAPLRCPPDKSITHRAFLFSLFSSRPSVVRNPLLGQDCLASLEAVRKLGAQVTQNETEVTIRGFGVRGFKNIGAASNPLRIDCQNSGTTMRLLTGILAGQSGYFRLTGDDSLSNRPMARVAEPLAKMGAAVHPRGKNKKGAPCPPLDIEPAPAGLRATHHESKVASAQVKSAILLAGLACASSERTSVWEPSLSRDHTERMLRGMGVDVHSQLESGGASAALMGQAGRDLESLNLTVGGDPSSAAFWFCAAVMQGMPLQMQNVLLNPTRLGFAEVLKKMGAALRVEWQSTEGGEPIGVLRLEAGASLQATEVSASEIPWMIDEVPVLAVTALWARGTTVFRGVQELRVKESDRLEAVLSFIRSVGGRALVQGDDLYVEGMGGAPKGPSAGDWQYRTLGDHRLAMTAVVTADALRREIVLDDADCIKVSYPSFFQHRESLGK